MYVFREKEGDKYSKHGIFAGNDFGEKFIILHTLVIFTMPMWFLSNMQKRDVGLDGCTIEKLDWITCNKLNAYAYSIYYPELSRI